ncbi:hypothetical protein GQX73_g7221 [Xylaria multiplex]|uniref:IDI-2 n=1 Tax=Xylaria multiplex TaxID=323545 RepID=A0A7C8MJM3_9PEZI|nr:hypothetical protein GQX73_g7221 [Xylaria multiplex]
MLFLNIVQLLALGASGVSASPSDIDECGTGGLYSVDISTLPEGVNPNGLRKCAEHPVANTTIAALEKRDCYYGAKPYGCTDGFCWKKCSTNGGGQWCWTAANGGFGDWIKCSSDDQCNAFQACGLGECQACGCSC